MSEKNMTVSWNLLVNGSKYKIPDTNQKSVRH